VLSQRLLDIQESERRAVARELHDEIGQVLTAVKLNLQVLGHAAAGSANLRDSIEFVEHAIRLVRDRAMDLRPALLDSRSCRSSLSDAVTNVTANCPRFTSGSHSRELR